MGNGSVFPYFSCLFRAIVWHHGFIASSAPYTTAYFHPSMLAQGLFGLSTSDTQQELYTLNRQAHLPLGKCGSTFKQAAKSSTVKVFLSTSRHFHNLFLLPLGDMVCDSALTSPHN